MTSVIIGVDPHKRSATIEIIGEREHVLHTGRFGTDQDGYHRMLAAGIRSGCGRWKAVRVDVDGVIVAVDDTGLDQIPGYVADHAISRAAVDGTSGR